MQIEPTIIICWARASRVAIIANALKLVGQLQWTIKKFSPLQWKDTAKWEMTAIIIDSYDR